mmetsp:Transcript_56765/g.159391  ORF Transcript_56765/g.159391 Transcript_56765/m.159391 type:complete len:247 (+) Transcript_56765:502-1242(+)
MTCQRLFGSFSSMPAIKSCISGSSNSCQPSSSKMSNLSRIQRLIIRGPLKESNCSMSCGASSAIACSVGTYPKHIFAKISPTAQMWFDGPVGNTPNISGACRKTDRAHRPRKKRFPKVLCDVCSKHATRKSEINAWPSLKRKFLSIKSAWRMPALWRSSIALSMSTRIGKLLHKGIKGTPGVRSSSPRLCKCCCAIQVSRSPSAPSVRMYVRPSCSTTWKTPIAPGTAPRRCAMWTYVFVSWSPDR